MHAFLNAATGETDHTCRIPSCSEGLDSLHRWVSSEDRDRDDLIKLHVAQPYKCYQSDPEHSSVECSERRHQL